MVERRYPGGICLLVPLGGISRVVYPSLYPSLAIPGVYIAQVH